MKPILGQHFLKDSSALEKITLALDIASGEIIIEIGAGHGELTGVLARTIDNAQLTSDHKKQAGKIIAIEKDPMLVKELQEKFSTNSNVEIVEGDIRTVLAPLSYKLSATNYKLIGNIPYYLTSFLFRLIEELDHKPSRAVFLIQKEVAERLTEMPPRMNKLAASVQFWAQPEIVMRVPRESFSPPPDVDSAVVVLTIDKKQKTTTSELYYKTVNTLFAQPRKTILNNLVQEARSKKIKASTEARGDIVKKLKKIGVNPEDRPQNLSVEDIEKIAAFFL